MFPPEKEGGGGGGRILLCVDYRLYTIPNLS